MHSKRSSLALGKVWTWNGDCGGVLISLLKSKVPANLDRTHLHFAAMQFESRRCNYMYSSWTQIKTEKEEHLMSSAAWVRKEMLCSAYRNGSWSVGYCFYNVICMCFRHLVFFHVTELNTVLSSNKIVTSIWAMYNRHNAVVPHTV